MQTVFSGLACFRGPSAASVAADAVAQVVPKQVATPSFGVPNLVYPQGVATCLGTRGIVRAIALRAWFSLHDASPSCPHLAFHAGYDDAPNRILRKCSGTSRLRSLTLTASRP